MNEFNSRLTTRVRVRLQQVTRTMRRVTKFPPTPGVPGWSQRYQAPGRIGGDEWKANHRRLTEDEHCDADLDPKLQIGVTPRMIMLSAVRGDLAKKLSGKLAHPGLPRWDPLVKGLIPS